MLECSLIFHEILVNGTTGIPIRNYFMEATQSIFELFIKRKNIFNNSLKYVIKKVNQNLFKRVQEAFTSLYLKSFFDIIIHMNTSSP